MQFQWLSNKTVPDAQGNLPATAIHPKVAAQTTASTIAGGGIIGVAAATGHLNVWTILAGLLPVVIGFIAGWKKGGPSAAFQGLIDQVTGQPPA